MKTTFSKFTAGLLLMSFSFAIIGCGADAPALDTNLQKQHSDKLISLRSYFDKAKGDYSALNEADKAEFLKLCDGDQETDFTEGRH